MAQRLSTHEINKIIEYVGSDVTDEFKGLLKDRRLKRTKGMVDWNITKPVKLSLKKYAHFTEPYANKLAKKFHKKWRKELLAAQDRFGVDARIITAILLVETSFGRFTGEYQPLSVFASIVLDIEIFVKKKEYKTLSKSALARFDRKKKWAVAQLKAISKITKKYPGLDFLAIRGSYAGAFGKCQFLPSRFLDFAVAAKKGRTPNLFDERDAIVSVANYLVKNGYKEKIDSEGAYKAIYHYNNSDVYVQTVRAVAKKLKKLS